MNKRYRLAIIFVAISILSWLCFRNSPEDKTSSTGPSSISPSGPAHSPSPASREVSSVPPSPTSQTQIQNEKEFRARFHGEWQFLRHENNIHSILGGPIAGYENSPEGAARFAQDIAKLFGVSPEQLDMNRISAVDTPLRQVYHIGQSSDGVPVYQGEIAVFFSKNAGTISMMNSELQSFDSKLEGPTLSARQASNAVETHREWENAHVNNVQGVVLFVQGRVAIPSYIMTAVAGDPQETWEVVVSGVTGEILHRHARHLDEDRKVH